MQWQRRHYMTHMTKKHKRFSYQVSPELIGMKQIVDWDFELILLTSGLRSISMDNHGTLR